MHLNRTSEWKVMNIWISRELSLFNSVRLDILCTWIGPPSEKLWPFEFLESFHCSISSVWIYYAPESDLRVKSYDHLNFSRASVAQFLGSRYIMLLNRTTELKGITIWISLELLLFNFRRLIYYASESDLRAKSYDHLNFSRASVFQFHASRYIIRLNQTSEWKVMTNWISKDLPLFNFKHLHMWCACIGTPC